jgi:hypothetical protein
VNEHNLSASTFLYFEKLLSVSTHEIGTYLMYTETLGVNSYIIFVILNSFSGRAMAQVVSRLPLTAEARVRARVNPGGICGVQNGTGTGFSRVVRFFPVNV